MTDLLDATSIVTAPEGRFPIAKSALTGIAIHHSVSGDGLTLESSEASERAHLQAIDRYHVEQGFGGIGYHLAAFPSGRLYRLGNLDAARAHVAGRNHELLGVVAIGTFTQRLPREPQMQALRTAVQLLRSHAGIHLPVKGHGTWALPGEGTACPGLLADVGWDAESKASSFMIRCNGFALSLENRRFASGAQDGVLDAAREFGLPPEAKAVRIEVALLRGAFAVGDGAYAGRVDERYGSRLGIIDANLMGGGVIHYDCPRGTEIERIGCLGYWV